MPELRVFISYRRADSADGAGRLYDDLRERLGSQVFMDIDTIEPGVDFTNVVNDAIGSCDVLLALIGLQWLSITDKHGKRRLDDNLDLVRLEIEAALDRDVRVIPLLLQGASMPTAEELPESLHPLTRRHAVELSPMRWHYDVARLLETLERLAQAKRIELDAEGKPQPEPSGPQLLVTPDQANTSAGPGGGQLTTTGPAGPVAPSGVEPAPVHGAGKSGQPGKRRLIVGSVIAGSLLAAVAIGAIFVLPPDPVVGPTPGATGSSTERSQPTTALSTALTIGRVTATSTASASTDAAGQRVAYEASNTIDHDPATAWRTPGRAIGESLTVTFDGEVQLKQIGLIPGYAKEDPLSGADRFTENRRVSSVRYEFDDGSSVEQEFDDEPTMQLLQVDVTTQSVTILILSTTGHGGRDFTAISEIEAFGAQ